MLGRSARRRMDRTGPASTGSTGWASLGIAGTGTAALASPAADRFGKAGRGAAGSASPAQEWLSAAQLGSAVVVWQRDEQLAS